ncbi:uncharacterized protein BDCG_06206 [Blastomyces dermatitidis ER-3]|uniref:Ecp2 effector protein domain-containing protein n=3 Tax=Ajellomyces dermatitidis TaxID=5039 RepID=F2THL5_AJEDA|nr:uncharacterized protein BDCG_06206 [Blastomyces dermatitidis ER-3]EEQ91086.1 hypothetical protein BDCG_06206 [Blastomyces dermatitidis ER-3]EGE82728.1 hypothetical protein BDDG_05672 [Blastomyces dermatitidis ATCC 18188]KMW67889.1 hypothetical protein, variant [Blastomyces dermatitidis ATCC 18188]
MLFSTVFLKYAVVLLATRAAAMPTTVTGFEPEPRHICFDETPKLHCYNGGNDIPQNVAAEDVSFIASYLRAYGRQTRIGRLFTMKAADAPDCGEWVLYACGTAAAYAKKINMTYDSSILFADIADTIDGGKKLEADSILKCNADGGSLGTQIADLAAPAYLTKEYVDGHFKPDGIIIKIVSNKAL